MAGETRGGPVENEHTIVVGVELLPTSFDPDQFMRSNAPHTPDNSDAQLQVFDRLMAYAQVRRDGTRMQDSGWLLGELIEGWLPTGDPRRHRARLRDATSVFGNTLSAEDVVWSWQKAFAGREVGRWAAFMGSVDRNGDGVREVDSRTVEFVLEQPNRLFPHILTMDVPPIFDSTEARRHTSPSDPWARDWLRENACGFGPYRVWKRTAETLELEARQDYWGGEVEIGRVVYREIPSGADRMRALIDGEVDIIYHPPAEDVLRLRGYEDIEVFSAPGTNHIAVQMDSRFEPFDDPLVRQALAWAVPYEDILRGPLKGLAKPWLGVVPESHFGYIELLSGQTDVEKSRSLLSRAGKLGKIQTTLYCDGDSPDLVEAARLVSQSAGLAGLTLEVDALPGRDLKKRQSSFSMPLALDHDGHRCNEIGYGLPHDFGDRRHGITNWIQYSNAGVDKHIALAEQETDPDRRIALFQECQRLVAADTPWAFVAQPRSFVAHRRGLRGVAWFSRGSGRPRYFELSWA